MSMVKFLLASFALFATIFTALMVLSHEETTVKIDPSNLDVQKPFGFSWEELPRVEDGQIGEKLYAECRNLVNTIEESSLIQMKGSTVEECVRGVTANEFLSVDSVPREFKNGEISVTVRGDLKPVAFSYSFLHRVLPHDGRVNRLRRKLFSARIKRALFEIYGEPDANGYYDQNRSPHFFVSYQEKPPCNFWVTKHAGIFLCTERVVLIDGIEMSLSFTHLERTLEGKLLHCAIEADAAACFEELEFGRLGPNTRLLDNLRVMAEWAGPIAFNRCEHDGLQPLEEAWAISASQQQRLERLLADYSGESLANYVFENYDDLPKLVPGISHNQITMYLLKIAASQGSFSAKGEIGSSLLFCVHGVEQDINASIAWLEAAAASNDTLAIKALALINILRTSDSGFSPEKSLALLRRCSSIDEYECSDELAALVRVLRMSEISQSLN